MTRGVMDRLLASPVRRGAMMIGTLAYQGITTVVQTLVVFVIAYVSGARFAGGVVGVLVTVVAAVLISVIIASLSNALALLLRQQEALIGISQFIVLPLQFLSSALMDTRLSPNWVAPDCPLQPSRLGSRRVPAVAFRRHRLGSGLATPRATHRPGRHDGLARHPRLRQLSAISLGAPCPRWQREDRTEQRQGTIYAILA